MAWIKGCEICNAGLLEEMDRLIEKGTSAAKASEILASQQEDKIGIELYSAENIRDRYRYHRGKKIGEIPQSDTRKDGVMGWPQGREKWPMCSQCESRPVNPRGKGVCRSCTYQNKRREELEANSKKYKEGQKKLDQAPIDPESDQYWRETTEKLNDYFAGFKSIPCGKVSKETLDAVADCYSHIRSVVDAVCEKWLFVQR